MPRFWRSTDPSSQQLAKNLAARQFGRVARYQLTHLGIGQPQIRSWLNSGWLIRRLPGVYAVGYVASSTQADFVEAVLYAGPGAMLTGAAGAWWLGLCDHRPKVIEVATPRRCSCVAGIDVRGRRAAPRIWHRSLPVAPVADVLFAFAATASQKQLRLALARTEFHGYLELDLLPLLMRPGKRGGAALRQTLVAHDPRLGRVRSPLEIDFLDFCREYGLPLPEVNVEVEGIEVDALWREQRVIVELDGGGNHRTAAQMHRDHGHDLLLRRAAYVVQRYSRPQVLFHGDEVADDLR